jgi:hypothetical protein
MTWRPLRAIAGANAGWCCPPPTSTPLDLDWVAQPPRRRRRRLRLPLRAEQVSILYTSRPRRQLQRPPHRHQDPLEPVITGPGPAARGSSSPPPSSASSLTTRIAPRTYSTVNGWYGARARTRSVIRKESSSGRITTSNASWRPSAVVARLRPVTASVMGFTRPAPVPLQRSTMWNRWRYPTRRGKLATNTSVPGP